MSQARKSNKTIRIFIMIIGLGIILWTLYQEKRPSVHTANLEYRMVTGVKNGQFQVIMMETADRFFVLDSMFRQTFESNEAEIVTRPEQIKLLEYYDDLQYRAGIVYSETGRVEQLRSSRDVFNHLLFQHEFLAELSKKVPDSLLTITNQ